jgi:hypothetical protein
MEKATVFHEKFKNGWSKMTIRFLRNIGTTTLQSAERLARAPAPDYDHGSNQPIFELRSWCVSAINECESSW